MPWGCRRTPISSILEQLEDDDSESLRKSVANNLNDISNGVGKAETEVMVRENPAP
jgi:3-methyladenine DNA glycosylase AlkC